MGDTTLIHHRDQDGFCAACVAKSFLLEDTTYHSIQHEEPVPWELIDGKKVYIIDFSFGRDVMKEIIRRAKSLVCLDHHDSAKKALDGLPGCHFDMDHAGCMLAHLYFHKHFEPHAPTVPRLLVRYVEDRDLWNWTLPKSKEINAAIYSYPMTFQSWDELISKFRTRAGVEDVLVDGVAVNRDQQTRIASLLPSARKLKFMGHSAVAVNCPLFTSDIGHELVMKHKDCDFAIVWKMIESGAISLSFTSTEKFDVSKLAVKLGGGGHPQASGASVDVASDAGQALLGKGAVMDSKSKKRVEAFKAEASVVHKVRSSIIKVRNIPPARNLNQARDLFYSALKRHALDAVAAVIYEFRANNDQFYDPKPTQAVYAELTKTLRTAAQKWVQS